MGFNSQAFIVEEKIESLRQILYSLLSSRKLTDHMVVVYSQELDKLIVEYEHLKMLIY